MIVVDVLACGFDLLEIRLMNRVIDGETVSVSTLDSDDVRQGVVGLLQVLALVVAVVFFVRWFHRAYRNLVALRGERRYRTAWAIASWFTPFLNLWRPKQIANDIWRGTDPSTFAVERGFASSTTPYLLRAWWAAWIVAGFAGRIAAIAWANTATALDAGATAALGVVSDAEDVRRTAILDLVASGLDIAAAVLAILVVRRMTSRQLQRAGALDAHAQEGPGEAVAAPSPA